MPPIGQLFVESGLITNGQLEEALRAKAVYGGRLGTNLVELGFIDDAILHTFLSRQLQVPAMAVDAQPEADALALLAPVLCDQLDAIPLRIEESGGLVVAAVDAASQALAERLAQAPGRPVRMVVASEGRLAALMREVLGIERPLRYAVVEAEARRAGRDGLQDTALHSILRDQAFSGPAPDPDEELMLLDVVVGEETLIEAEPPAPLVVGTVEDLPPATPELAPVVPAPVVPAAEPSAEEVSASFADDLQTQELSFEPLTTATIRPEVAAAHAGLGEEQRPLSFEKVLGEIAACQDREALARLVLRYMLNHYRRVLMFSVQRGLVLGWDGMGDRVDRDLAQKLMIPVNAPSVFGLACASRQPYQGALAADPLTKLFIKILGGDWPAACHLVPFQVGERLVAILYGDGPLGEISAAHDHEFSMLASQVQSAFARFMARVGGSTTD